MFGDLSLAKAAHRSRIRAFRRTSRESETERTRTAFDELRMELGRLFLAASISEGNERDRARELLASLLAPKSRRGPPQKLAVTQRNAIVASYLSGTDDPDVRAERMSVLENRILPKSAEHLGWPADLSLDLGLRASVAFSPETLTAPPPPCPLGPWDVCRLPAQSPYHNEIFEIGPPRDDGSRYR